MASVEKTSFQLTPHRTSYHAIEGNSSSENKGDTNEAQETAPTANMVTSKQVLCACSITVIVFGLAAAIGLILQFKLPKDPEPGPRSDAVGDCIPQGENTKGECERRGCFWREPTDGAPWCTFPSGYGYVMDGPIEEITRGYRVNLTMSSTKTQQLYSKDISEMSLYVEFHTDERLRIKFTDRTDSRFQVPPEAVNIEIPRGKVSNETRLYDVIFVEEPQFGIMVIRKSSGAKVFDTTLPGLTFSEQYHQLTTRLPSDHLYGLGEHNHRQFKHDMEWRNWTIFTRDTAPVDDWNLYGAQPMYMNIEEDGNANAILLLNSNAMDIVLQPKPFPAVTFHVIGGILDFYVFLGPSPESVVQEYTEATGRPIMPPYWSLGFQLSRWGYDGISDVKKVLERNVAAGIPLDVQYGDIDYMESFMDFTYDKENYDGLPEFVDSLHDNNMRYILLLDHTIPSNTKLFDVKLNGSYPPFTEGVTQDVFIRDPRDSSHYLRGTLWPGEVVFPDFAHPNATIWWQNQCEDLYYNQGIKYDALWIDMNEPTSLMFGSTTGCEENAFNYPPYLPDILGDELYSKTICMDSLQQWGRHYDVHSLYGHSMSITAWQALRSMFPGTRPLILTRSNFAGTQKYAAHWLGDNQSEWSHMSWSIVGMLEYSLFGFSYTGADICGFKCPTTEEMCIRWTELGAFYPYARNHNEANYTDQDPAAFGPTMVRIAKDILETRYKLLPYLYTLMHEAHTRGSTVVRPMMHEFASDSSTWAVDAQFLWGPALLITPVITEGETSVTGYFPDTRWYDYYGGKLMEDPGTFKDLPTPLDKINLHIRGGYIIPWQEPAMTTVASRQNPMGLLVALGEPPEYEAHGSLFWDDGESFETYENGKYLFVVFTTSNFKLDITVDHNGMGASSLQFDTIDIWGLPRELRSVLVNNIPLSSDNWSYNPLTQAVQLINLGLPIDNNHVIEWETSLQGYHMDLI